MKEYRDLPMRIARCEHSNGKWYIVSYDLDKGGYFDRHDCLTWNYETFFQWLKRKFGKLLKLP